jgi:RHS repeat-associated protein
MQFAGQYTDSESGFQYLRARYYDPATDQFLNQDPIVAQTRQSYSYVVDSPVNFSDPSRLTDRRGQFYEDYSGDITAVLEVFMGPAIPLSGDQNDPAPHPRHLHEDPQQTAIVSSSMSPMAGCGTLIKNLARKANTGRPGYSPKDFTNIQVIRITTSLRCSTTP